jgi:DNA repair exonuclease SbcCD ATPase subunit
MHRIILKTLTFSNVLSYGNNENVVNFVDGLTWIKGPNGAGKSTIIEALTFALFNTPYRSIKKAELKNTANKSKLKVELVFTRVDNKSTDEYIINREMNKSGSSTFTIAKNGEIEKKGAGTTQKTFEDEVLGFNKNIFENVISLNTIQTTPFIDMEPKDKRKLLESILTLSIDKFKELNTKKLREVTTRFDSSTSDVRKYSKDTHDLSVIIADMEKEREHDISVLETDLQELITERDNANNELLSVVELMDSITEEGKAKKLELDKFGDLKQEQSELENVRVYIPQLDDKKNALSVETTKLSSLEAKKKEYEGKLAAYGIDVVKNRVTDYNAESKTLLMKVASYSGAIKTYNDQLTHIEEDAKSLHVGVPCPTCGKESTEGDVESLKKEYRKQWKDKKAEIKSAEDEIENINKTLKSITESTENDQQIISEWDALNTEYTEFNNNDFKQCQYKITTLNTDISNIENKINDLNIGSVEDIDTRLSSLNILIKEKDDLVSTLNELRSKLSLVQQDKNNKSTVVSNLDTRIKKLSDTIEEKKNNANDNSLTLTKKKLEEAEQDLETANNKVLKYSDEIEICKYIKSMYDDTGIKKLVLGIFVPNLNKAIAHNFELFGLPFTLEFDDAMNDKFSSKFGLSPVYNGLSQGQKRKLNFAIAMAFRDFVTAIADFDINTLFLDEVLDISTDTEALKDMIVLLRNKVKEIGGIYIITHRGEIFDEYFDNQIEVQHDGRYSSLVMSQLISTKTNY